MKRRQVQHYGFEFNYRINDINRASPLAPPHRGIPEPFHALMERMRPLGVLDRQRREELASNACVLPAEADAANELITMPYAPDQLTVNKYDPGHGIPPHVDTHSAFTDIIISISLQSTIVMELQPTPSAQFLLKLPPQPVNIVLPPRSLLCLSGISRYGYTHAIIPRRTDRISNVLTNRQQRTSLTFRQLRQMHTSARQPVCRCQFTTACDTKEAILAETASPDHIKEEESTEAASAPQKTLSPIPTPASPLAAPTISAPLPPPPSRTPLTPEIEACHIAACAAGQDTYTDPATGYSVFTAVGLERVRKGVCCGNACRHCPYDHANVGMSRQEQRERRRQAMRQTPGQTPNQTPSPDLHTDA